MSHSLQQSLLLVSPTADIPSFLDCVEQTERQTEHMWSCSRGAKHGASPARSQHHKHTQNHTLVPKCPKMLLCGGTEEIFVLFFLLIIHANRRSDIFDVHSHNAVFT